MAGDYVPTRRRFTADDDGLSRPWHGFVWCNPPYSNVKAWAGRMIDHGHGLLLAPLSTNTQWTSDVLAVATTVTPLPQIKFISPDHTERHVSFGIMLYALGELAATAAERLPDTFRRVA